MQMPGMTAARRTAAMRLSELLSRLSASDWDPARGDPDVRDVDCDSRKTRPGTLFVAIDGVRDDGARYVADALSRGAVAVVSERPAPPDVSAPWARVPDARAALALLSCAVHGDPTRHLAVYAITGTNGKTTTAGLLRDVLEAAGVRAGLLSTVEYAYPGHCEEASRTTPDACSLQRYFAEMRTAGCRAAVMEASSHALVQSRTGGIRFAAAGFTNLSRDHFDYHKDFEDYFAAKCILFRQLGEGTPGAAGVVNADDPYGRRLLAMLPGMGVRPVSYGIGGDADIRAEDVELDARGSRFTLVTPAGRARVESALLGRYNVSNLLCVAGLALAGGVAFDVLVRALAAARPRWGRLEKVAEVRGASVFVDYAHTPDAIEKALMALREITRGRLSIVFGCGGDRDRAKRPQMAEIAARLADRVILTSDNPRTEDPEAILDEVQAGIPAGRGFARKADRRAAIRLALAGAGEGDCVLVAGKGHETYQEINGVKHPFDDRDVVREEAGTIG